MVGSPSSVASVASPRSHLQLAASVERRRRSNELAGACLHPLVIVGTQPRFTLQERQAGQTTGSTRHVPPEHTSPVVHGLPSSHAVSSGLAVPTHCPFTQTSPSVQLLRSSHAPVRLMCWHWPVALHRSLVQGLPSSSQAVSAGRSTQSLVQQPPLVRFPSSQVSPGSSWPLPQRLPFTPPDTPTPWQSNPPLNEAESAAAVAWSATAPQAPAVPLPLRSPVAGSMVP